MSHQAPKIGQTAPAERSGLARALYAPVLSNWLAWLYAPIQPQLNNLLKIERKGPRRFNPDDILLPEGYRIELVASGFNAPVHCTFDDQGYCYVVESGHKIDAVPRILRVDLASGRWEPYYTLPRERWNKTGAVTGACWHDGSLYLMNTSTLLRLDEDGNVEEVVSGLRGDGDHQANYPVAGPDGKLYFGQGSATNSGIVGADNFAYEWLADFPDFHDLPAQDVTLSGRNYEEPDVLNNLRGTVRTGAFVPYGVETHPGQIIEGNVKCNGAILRCNLDGSDLEVVAWGLRNPFGIAFHPDGRLFASEHGMDQRSQRYVTSDPDDLYEIHEDAWYGWPDFAAGIPLDDPYWQAGRGREPVLAEHPDPNPPKPFLTFPVHVGANGLDFCRDEAFGFAGDAFVALFGDLAPFTTLHHALKAHGYKVVRVDMRNRRVVDFAVNKIEGSASWLPQEGFERPSHVQFGPDGSLYVVDYGIIRIAPEAGGIRMQQETGALWRIRRTSGPRGEVPPKPLKLPARSQVLALGLGAAAALIAGALWLRRKLRRPTS